MEDSDALVLSTECIRQRKINSFCFFYFFIFNYIFSWESNNSFQPENCSKVFKSFGLLQNIGWVREPEHNYFFSWPQLYERICYMQEWVLDFGKGSLDMLSTKTSWICMHAFDIFPSLQSLWVHQKEGSGSGPGLSDLQHWLPSVRGYLWDHWVPDHPEMGLIAQKWADQ